MPNVVTVLAMVVGLVVVYYGIDWLRALAAMQKLMWVNEAILALARGAEQCLGRGRGPEKLQWVKKAAKARGIPCTDADIEAAAWIVNYIDGAKADFNAPIPSLEVADGRR